MPPIDRLAIYERDQGVCGFCRLSVPLDDFHLDHVVPRSLGGLTVADNLRVAHRRCNQAASPQVCAERRRQGLPVLRLYGTPPEPYVPTQTSIGPSLLPSTALAVLRRRKMLTQRQLAAEAHVAPSTIYVLEAGRRTRPRFAVLQKIAAALGVDVTEVDEFRRVIEGSSE